jgi:glycosyltransferase involved in cell wall biosynthesis
MFDVVMSLYNTAPFVEQTVAAVVAQSFSDWRLIVVDDGSTDGGAEIVRRFDDPRITLIRQENQGVGPARNAGIRAGSAEWIALLDGDDVWNADHLAELDALRRSFPDAALVGCGFARFSGSIVPLHHSTGGDTRRLARYFAESARGAELFFTSSAAARRSALNSVGLFEPLPGNEDVELWARLALHGPVAVSSKRTVNYRVDTGGITDAGMRGRKPPPKPMKREELSSTIPTLTRLLPSITDSSLRREVAEYMDSKVGLALVAAVLKGDIVYARHLSTLYEGKPLGKARIAATIARLPTPLARTIVGLGQGIKRVPRVIHS